MTVRTEHPHIVKVEGVRGGSAIVCGTRIPVWLVIAIWKDGCSPEDVLEHYPQLTPAKLFDALSYYYDHPHEIEADLEAQNLTDSELAHLQAQWPPQSSS